MIEQLLIKHEGYSCYPYECTKGRLTIGYGRNLESRGITRDEARYLMRNDIHRCQLDLRRIFGRSFDNFNEDRQNALIDMRFNLGYKGFRGFKKFIAAIKRGDFEHAIWEMKYRRLNVFSPWYIQVTGRVEDLMRLMK
jgi:lysozyme